MISPPAFPGTRIAALGLVVLAGCLGLTAAQPTLTIPINEIEEAVPPYTLPEVLTFRDGRRVESARDWPRRRAELLSLFEHHVYGRVPKGLPRPAGQVVETRRDALGGKAVRQRIQVPLTRGPRPVLMDLLVYRPAAATGPVPVFLGLNFDGNHTVTPETDVPLARGWVANRPRSGVTNHVASEASRGTDAAAWPIERILERGYGLATAYYGDIEADFDGGWRQGLRGAIVGSGPDPRFAPEDWGAISAWSWGLSRALDQLARDPAIDAGRVAVIGHSRLGKTALWAGARDPRFALVIANESGEGGAALARRFFGETTLRINTSFPHWFNGRFKDYNHRVSDLPVDQHELVALVAPRPVYIASAEQDRWADPRGEYLSGWHAGPVYRLLGQEGLPGPDLPPLNRSVGDAIGYHLRTGAHALTGTDWEFYLQFADRHLRRGSRATASRPTNPTSP